MIDEYCKNITVKDNSIVVNHCFYSFLIVFCVDNAY